MRSIQISYFQRDYSREDVPRAMILSSGARFYNPPEESEEKLAYDCLDSEESLPIVGPFQIHFF